MARKISEIYDALNAEKASMEELNVYVTSTQVPGSTEDNSIDLAIDVISGSKVAIWRLWLWIMAVGSWMVEVLFDRHKSDITETLEAKRVHTCRWYAEESKKFQYGYTMVWDRTEYNYATDDPEARLVKYAAAAEKDGKVILKVAKEVGGTKVPLAILEKTAFVDFWTKWKDAGVKLEVISANPDQLKVNMTIIRDRLVLDGNNNLLRDNAINPIDLAIEAFGNGLEFDGILRLSKLDDAVQAAEGVIDVKTTGAWHKASGGSYAAVNMFVESYAGYFELNVDDSTMTYQDNVEVSVFD